MAFGSDPIGRITPSISGSTSSVAGTLTATETLDPNVTLRQSITGRVTSAGDASYSGTVGANYNDGSTTLDGSVTRTEDSTAVNVSGSQNVAEGLRFTERAGVTIPDNGRPQGTFAVGQTYSSPNIVESLNVEGGVGAQNYIRADGSIDIGLANGLYGAAFASYGAREGQQDTASIGGSLTFSLDEFNALTAAGVVDQNGAIEVRIQYDLFRRRVESVQGLTSQRRDALFSAFISLRSDNGQNRLLDSRLGAPSQQLETGPGESAVIGVRTRF